MATVTLTQLRYLRSAFTCCTPGCGKLLDAGSKSIPCGHTYCEACVYAQIDSRNACAVCEVPVMIGQVRSCTLLQTLIATVNDLIARCEATATTATATARTPALAALSELAPPLPASATARIGESSPVTPRRLSETPTTPACLPAAAASSSCSASSAAAPASPSPAGAAAGAAGAGAAALLPSPGFGPSGSPRLLCSPPPPPPPLPSLPAGSGSASASSAVAAAAASAGGWEGVRGMMGSRWDLSYRAILEAVGGGSGGGGSGDAGGPSAAAVAALHRVREIDEELEAHSSVLSAQGVSVDTADTPVVRRRKRPREEAAAAVPAVATTSGLSRSVRCEVEKECADAGVRYVEHDGPSSMAADGVTHLLTIDPAPRTLKYCFAIARGLWVLRRQVLHGLEYGGLEASGGGGGGGAAAAVARAEVRGDTGKGAAAARGPGLGRLARAAREEGRRSFCFEGREYPAVLLEGFAYTLCEPLLAVTAADVGALCVELGAVKVRGGRKRGEGGEREEKNAHTHTTAR